MTARVLFLICLGIALPLYGHYPPGSWQRALIGGGIMLMAFIESGKGR